MILKEYEIEVLRLLLTNLKITVSLEALLQEVKLVSYEETKSGYFLTLKHPNLPRERSVFSAPTIMGSVDGVDCGFVAFVENGQLTLECHTWGAMDIPKKIRDKDIRVKIG